MREAEREREREGARLTNVTSKYPQAGRRRRSSRPKQRKDISPSRRGGTGEGTRVTRCARAF